VGFSFFFSFTFVPYRITGFKIQKDIATVVCSTKCYFLIDRTNYMFCKYQNMQTKTNIRKPTIILIPSALGNSLILIHSHQTIHKHSSTEFLKAKGNPHGKSLFLPAHIRENEREREKEKKKERDCQESFILVRHVDVKSET
jgi:hypothetical protein